MHNSFTKTDQFGIIVDYAIFYPTGIGETPTKEIRRATGDCHLKAKSDTFVLRELV